MTKLLPPINRTIRRRLEQETGMRIVVKICALRFVSNNSRFGYHQRDTREEKIKVFVGGKRNLKLMDLSKIKKIILKTIQEVYEVCEIPGKVKDVKITFHF